MDGVDHTGHRRTWRQNYHYNSLAMTLQGREAYYHQTGSDLHLSWNAVVLGMRPVGSHGGNWLGKNLLLQPYVARRSLYAGKILLSSSAHRLPSP